jgi:two-component system sensor histidine kinase YesM
MIGLKLKASPHYPEASDYSKYMAERAIRYMLPMQLRNTRQNILGTIILPMDGSVYQINAMDRSPLVPDFPYSQQDWYAKAFEKDGNVAYISSHPQNYLEMDAAKQVFSVARLLKDPDSGRPLGVIMTDVANVVLANIIRENSFNTTTIVAMFDEDHKLLYTNHPLKPELMSQFFAGKTTVSGDGDSYRAVMKTMPKSGWSMVVLFSDQEFQSQLKWIYRMGALFAAGGILVTMFLNISLTNWIVKPFRKMVHVMKKVQRGDLDQRLTIHGKDEIAQLGMTLNTMISQLQELIDREFRAVLGQRNAEYRALQSQIQPHFLYNTLNGFVGLNRSGQHRLLEKCILSLSSMLRYTLEHGDMTTLREEMNFLEQYCELQRLRFQDRLTVDIGYDSDMGEIRLPKLLLQPLVENAIIHGIEPQSGAGKVEIMARRVRSESLEADRILIRILDNGVGFKSDDALQGVGLHNVRERLALFSKEAQLHMHSTIGVGTKIEIRIPIKDVSSSEYCDRG